MVMISSLVMNYGQRMNPHAHRHPPQVGWTFPKQSSMFSFAISQLLQNAHGEKSKS
jgi:hypothetical protein